MTAADQRPWLLMITAPVAVIVSLLLLRSVWAVFAVYHLGICLGVPLVLGRRAGGWSGLGLRPAGTEVRYWPRNLGLGLALGVGVGGFLLGANALLGGQFLTAQQIAGVLGRWGVTPGLTPLAAAFMVLVNGPAEEVFWRGFVQARLGPLPRPFPWLLVPSFFYASYHAVTVFLFLDSLAMAAAILLGIALAGCGWAGLRWRTGSLWPALVSHQLLTVAYVIIWLNLSRG